MTRAAVCVMGADPFLDAYWLRNFASWADKVDELRIVVCGLNPEHRIDLAGDITDSLSDPLQTSSQYLPGGTDHGVAIRKAMEGCTADVVMLCEEDAYVSRPEAVEEAFARIERGETDVIGGPRGNMTPELREWANRTYGQLEAETGEAGPILWPCFLWARRADLEATDRHYGAIGWMAGTPILGQRYDTDQAADTFGWTSLQLRANGARVAPIGQYRADLAKMPGWSDAPWFHVGGLSTGWGVYLMGSGQHDPAGQRGQDLTDWTKRVAWWRRMAACAPGPEHLRERYRSDIEKLVAAMGMDEGQIAQWAEQFARLVTWAE